MSSANRPSRDVKRGGFLNALKSAFAKFAYVYPFLQLLLLVPLQWVRTDQDRDVTAYYLAVERIDRGQSMYEPHPPPGPHVPEWYYLYPPFLASAVSLLPSVSFVAFARVWLIALIIAFWVYAACLCKLARGRVTPHGTLVWGALLGLTPGLMHALNMGQADVLVWPMIGLALAFPAVRGAGFAAAALTKVHGIWPLAVSFFREGRRVLVSAVLCTAAAVFLAIAAIGPSTFVSACIEWFRYIAPSLGQGQFDPGNPSMHVQIPFGPTISVPPLVPTNLSVPFLPIMLARRAGWWEYAGGELPPLMQLYLAIVGIAAPIIAAWLFRHQPRVLHYSLVLAFASVFAPIFRITNLPLLLVPLAAWLGTRLNSPRTEPAAEAAQNRELLGPGTHR